MRRDANLFSYLDYGVGHFGDFIQEFELCMTDSYPDFGGCTSIYVGWGLTNTPGAWTELLASNDSLVAMMYPGGSLLLKISDQTNDNGDTFSPIVKDARYFCRAIRNGTTFQLFIYSDAEMTSLEDTLTIDCTALAFRYLMNATSQHSLTGRVEHNVTAYMQHLDIHERSDPAPGSVRSLGRAGLATSARARVKARMLTRR